MSNGKNPVGVMVEKALDACFGDIVDDNVRGLLRDGDYRGAASAFKQVVSVRGPVGGLEKAVSERFPGADTSLIRGAMQQAEYGVVVDNIVQLATATIAQPTISEPVATESTSQSRIINPYENNALLVAKNLCGSIISYEGNEALISKISGWSAVGGDDQTFPTAVPGTVGSWHSNAYGGYDIGIISAHNVGESGIVAFYGLRPIIDGKVKGEVTSKNKIASEWGFMDTGVYGRNLVSDPSVSMKIRLNDSDMVKVGNNEFRVVMEGTEKERTTKSGDMMLGTYKLVKA